MKSSPDRRRIYLDRTLFYPTSGGQPHDTGCLAGHHVVDVVDEGDQIAHVLGDPLEAGVAMLSGEIDWTRRYDHMQQHTGQHLLSAVFSELFQAPTLSFHMGAEVSTIELGVKSLTDVELEAAELRANELAQAALPVRIGFEDSENVSELRKASARSGTLRIIEIEGVDRSACGGTHVRCTAEVAPIQIRGTEKIRGNVRLEFVCGMRAVLRARADYEVLIKLVRESGSALERLPEWLASQRQKAVDIDKERQRLLLELAAVQAAESYRTAPVSVDQVRRRLLRVRAIDEAARATARAFTSFPKAAMLVLSSEPPGAMLAVSPDSQLHAANLLQALLREAGGRGGGSAQTAQGSLPSVDAAEKIPKALGFSSEGVD